MRCGGFTTQAQRARRRSGPPAPPAPRYAGSQSPCGCPMAEMTTVMLADKTRGVKWAGTTGKASGMPAARSADRPTQPPAQHALRPGAPARPFALVALALPWLPWFPSSCCRSPLLGRRRWSSFRQLQPSASLERTAAQANPSRVTDSAPPLLAPTLERRSKEGRSSVPPRTAPCRGGRLWRGGGRPQLDAPDETTTMASRWLAERRVKTRSHFPHPNAHVSGLTPLDDESLVRGSPGPKNQSYFPHPSPSPKGRGASRALRAEVFTVTALPQG
jgi:hypothetical protein